MLCCFQRVWQGRKGSHIALRPDLGHQTKQEGKLKSPLRRERRDAPSPSPCLDVVRLARPSLPAHGWPARAPVNDRSLRNIGGPDPGVAAAAAGELAGAEGPPSS